MTNKKFIALLVAICLCASALPIVVLAKTANCNLGASWQATVEYDAVNVGEDITLDFAFDSSVDTSNVSFHVWAVDPSDADIFSGLIDPLNLYEYGGDSHPVFNTASTTLVIPNATAAMNNVKIYAFYGDNGSNKAYVEVPLEVTSGAPGATPDGMSLAGPYIYDEDLDVMMTPEEAEGTYEYGEDVYYLLIDEVSTVKGPMSDRDYVEKLKAKVKGWQEGGSLVEGAEIIKRRVNIDPTGDKYHCGRVIESYGFESGLYYFLRFDIGEKDSLSETDVIGVVEFNRKADNKKGIGKIDESSHDIAFTVFYENSWMFNTPTIVSDKADLEWDTVYALKFDNDDEVELSFGSPNGGNNEGTFEVDISGQGKILLSYSTEAVEEIAAANEGAVMNYLLFNNARFNRSGTFTYEMEDGAYAYRIVDGKLVEIPGCYDESEEAFVFTTNILQQYVFADRELVNPA